MAAVKGVNKTIIDAQGESKLLQGLIDGRVKVMLDSYVPLGTEAAASTIALGALLPAGANILAALLITDANASATLSIGDSNLATRYASAQTINAAGLFWLNLIASAGYIIGTNSNDNQIIATTGGATLTINKKILVAIFYTLD